MKNKNIYELLQELEILLLESAKIAKEMEVLLKDTTTTEEIK